MICLTLGLQQNPAKRSQYNVTAQTLTAPKENSKEVDERKLYVSTSPIIKYFTD